VTDAPKISLFRALAFPFTQKNWPQALAYIAAIQFVPVLGYLIVRGWRFEIAQRVGAGRAEQLPDWRHAWRHLKEGTLLFIVMVVHYIPMYLLLSAPRWGILAAVWRVLKWIYVTVFTDVQPEPLSRVLDDGLQALAIFVAILLIVPPITSAIIEAATQRYAHTGRVRTL
jgi:hypothetical protein